MLSKTRRAERLALHRFYLYDRPIRRVAISCMVIRCTSEMANRLPFWLSTNTICLGQLSWLQIYYYKPQALFLWAIASLFIDTYLYLYRIDHFNWSRFLACVL
ncbi:hypothetical protein F4774DRAFT_344367 [Daldinia eschscholtzii]|nr:hypothetical protein F4774DRAFT_344367 [Daldinia eschscholtzii]